MFPLPRRDLGRATFTWSRPTNEPCGPAYATGSAVDVRVRELIETGGALAVTEPVVMEVLAGARDRQREERLRRLMMMRYQAWPLRWPGASTQWSTAFHLQRVAQEMSAAVAYRVPLGTHLPAAGRNL